MTDQDREDLDIEFQEQHLRFRKKSVKRPLFVMEIERRWCEGNSAHRDIWKEALPSVGELLYRLPVVGPLPPHLPENTNGNQEEKHRASEEEKCG